MGPCYRNCAMHRIAILLGIAFPPSALLAQVSLDAADVRPATVGEAYMRAVETAALSPVRPVLSPLMAQLQAEPRGPWQLAISRRSVAALRTELFVSNNSAIAYGGDDGPLWQGRGINASFRLGAVARWRRLTVVAAPVLAVSSNEPFAVGDNGRGGDTALGDWRNPTEIDRPQRFGTSPYWLVDPGTSMIRFDAGAIAFGVGTSNEVWGPSVRYPLVLGVNAAGIPRVFVETDRGINLGLASLRARIIWGRLDQSPVAVQPASRATRYASGFTASLSLMGAPLELGVNRFIHRRWPRSFSLRELLRPFKAVFAEDVDFSPAAGPDNQLASVFFRWVFAPAAELYGEYGREDYAWEWNDLLQEPDHRAAWSLGLRRVWTAGERRVVSLLVETLNARPSRLVLSRPQPLWYTHHAIRQGHTNRGQVLGADAVFGGAGTSVVLDVYLPWGKWGVRASRELMGQEFLFQNTNPRGADVQLALGGDVMVFRGPWELGVEVVLLNELNRFFGADLFNVRTAVALAYNPGRCRGCINATSSAARR